MKKLAKKLACAVLAGTMGLSMLAGCGSDKIDGTKPLITGGEETITIGTGNLMLRMNQAQMASYYAMMGGSTAGMWEQDAGNGKTYADTTTMMDTDFIFSPTMLDTFIIKIILRIYPIIPEIDSLLFNIRASTSRP